MKLRLYLFGLYFSAIVSAGLSAMIVTNVNPFEAPFWMVAIFYVSVFIFLTSFFGLVFFYYKVWASNREVIFAHLVPTLRQASFIALTFVGLLFLQQVRVLTWWVGALFIFAIFLIELFFRSKHLGKA